MPIINIKGRRIRVGEENQTVTAGGRRIVLDQGQPSIGSRLRNLLQAIQRPSRQIGQAVREITPRGRFLPGLLSPSRAIDPFRVLERRIPGIQQVRRAEEAIPPLVAGEIARTVTNPIDLAILALAPQLIPARAARLVAGAGLGAAAALGEEQVTPAQTGLRAGLVGLLSALPPTRRARQAFRVAEPSPEAIPRPIELAPGPSAATPLETRVQKVVLALEEAAPVRGEQEVLFTAERGKRLARVLGIRKELGGEAGFRAELAQLKGELPKVQFESIRGRIKQSDIDGLFDDINSAPIDPWEQITAKGGLAKLLAPEGGQIPTQGEINLLGRIFGPAFVKALRQKRPMFQKFSEAGVEIANLPRAILASFDLSAPLRQGLFLIGQPRQWLPAFGGMFRKFASEKTFQAAQEGIRSRPTFSLMKQARLALTEIGESVTKREEQFMSRLGERIPAIGTVVRASNRGYVGFLNKLRADVFDDFVKKGQQLGIAEEPGFLRSVARYVNAATGRGELGRFEPAAVIMNTVFFSPRLLASRFQLLNPIFYTRLHPIVRKRALVNGLTMVSAGLSTIGLAKLNGVNVGTDPRSADFGKMKIGNTRFDVWGGFQQPAVALMRLLTGETVSSVTGRVTPLTGEFGKASRADIIFRFLQSKQAPVLSFITTMLRGQTVGRGPAQFSVELIDRFIPIFIQDLAEITREHGIARGWMALPGAFGVGIQTYGDFIPVLRETPAGRPSVRFRDEPTLGEILRNRLTGQRVSNLPESFREPLAAAKRLQIQRRISLEEAKEIVRQTGRAVQVGQSVVFRDAKGIIRTRTQGRMMTPERILGRLLRQ